MAEKPVSVRLGGQFAIIPKGTAVLLVTVSKREELMGIACGVSAAEYRDRPDRF